MKFSIFIMLVMLLSFTLGFQVARHIYYHSSVATSTIIPADGADQELLQSVNEIYHRLDALERKISLNK